MRRQSYLAEPRAVANMMRCVGPSPLSQSHTEGHRGPSPMASPRTPGAITVSEGRGLDLLAVLVWDRQEHPAVRLVVGDSWTAPGLQRIA